MSNRHLKFFFVGILIIVMILPLQISLVSSSSGKIYINSTSPSKVGQQVQSGGNVSLYFANVMWSLGDPTVYLFMSTNGQTSISSGDFVYTPQFMVNNITSTKTTSFSDNNNGAWTVGNYWVNGTIAQNLAVGNYYIKAFDQNSTGSVAVTDTYITVSSQTYNATLNVSPPAGPGGVTIQFTGSRYPENSNVTISYYNPTFGTWNFLASTVANASGDITASSQAPDLEKSLPAGECPQQFTQISYQAAIGSITYASVSYDEYERGLSVVGNAVATQSSQTGLFGNTTGVAEPELFGNGTDLASTVNVMSGDTIPISGEWFYPGAVYIRWDSANVVGTVTSAQWQNAEILSRTVAGVNGTFATSITIPQCEAGNHYIQVQDSQTWMTVTIFVNTASLSISPAIGPGGVDVEFTGSHYPASTSVNVTYLNPTFNTWNVWTTTTSNASGNIALTCQMPDLQYSLASGDYSSIGNLSSVISFRTEINGVVWSYSNFYECYRGIKQVGNQIANGLYGNGTDLSSSVSVYAGESIPISGEWFHPGIIYIRFDGVPVVATVTSSAWQTAEIIGSTDASSNTGSFSTYATIPTADAGNHFLAIEDSQTRLIIIIKVLATTPTPTPAPTPSATPTPTAAPSPTPSPLPSPTLTVLCTSSTSYIGFNVEINGNLDINGAGLPGVPVSISYSTNEGNSWQDLTVVNTASDGSFSVEWLPSVIGNYLIKATYAGNSAYSSASSVVNLVIMPLASQNAQAVFSVASNSTVTDLAFNSTSRELSFTVSGPSGTGYVDAYIAKSLIADISTLKVYLDGNQLNYTAISQGNSWLIYFTYGLSTHTVVMSLGVAVSKPSTAVPVGIIAIATIVVVIGVVVVLVGLKTSKRNKQK
jgi:hypothetical protein